MRAAAHATSSASEHMQPSFGGWGWPRKILRHNHEHCQHFSTSQRPTYLSLGLGGLRWSEKNATFHAFGKAVCWRPSRSLFLFREGVKWRVWVLKYQVSTWVRWWVWTLERDEMMERREGRREREWEEQRLLWVERWALETDTDRGECDMENVNEGVQEWGETAGRWDRKGVEWEECTWRTEGGVRNELE